MAVHYLGPVRNGDATVLTSAGTGLNKVRDNNPIPSGSEQALYQNWDGRYLGSEWDQPFGSGLANAPSSADTGAQVYFAAKTNNKHVIGSLSWSYDDTPTSGVLSIESPSGTTVWSQNVTQSGPGQFDFGEDGLELPEGNEAIITLGGAGASVKGSVSVDRYRLS